MSFDYSLPLERFRESLQQKKNADLAAHLWDTRSLQTQIEPLFLQVLENYFAQQGFEPDIIAKIKNQLHEYPILQTSHHITPTNGATFLGIDLLSLSKKPAELYYLVAANSGVSFSNAAWSGALSFDDLSLEKVIQKQKNNYQQIEQSIKESQNQSGSKEKKVSLILSKYRDALLFNKEVKSVINQNHSTLADFYHTLPQLTDYQYYTDWALNYCMQIQQSILNDKTIIYFDVNQLINNYLIELLSQETVHPILSLLFDNKEIENLSPTLFIGDKVKKSSYKTETIDLKTLRLNYSQKELLIALKNQRFAASSFLLYFILNAVHNICCLGSFLQYQYIQEYSTIWQRFFPHLNINERKQGFYRYSYFRLTKNNKAIYPLDLYIKGETIDLKEKSFDF